MSSPLCGLNAGGLIFFWFNPVWAGANPSTSGTYTDVSGATTTYTDVSGGATTYTDAKPVEPCT